MILTDVISLELLVKTLRKCFSSIKISVLTHDPVYFPLVPLIYSHMIMASGSGERTDSDKEQEEQLPQISPDQGKSKKHMRGTGISSKPPKAPKKKADENPEEEIPEQVAQPEAGVDAEDVAVIEDQDFGSEDRPRRGGRGQEPNTTTKMSDPKPYRTPPHGETLNKRNTCLQKICRQWAKK